MTTSFHSLTYDGYWLEAGVQSIPDRTGVYSVYACRHNAAANTVAIRKLIYIGEAQNVRNRVSRHEKTPAWRRHLAAGEELCFNFAPIVTGRARVEAALIHHHKPPENTEYVDSFPFEETTVGTGGQNELLANFFVVYPTPQRAAFAYR